MRRFGVSLVCTCILMVVVSYFSLDSALESIEKVKDVTGAVQVKQLEKIDLLNELQGIED